MSARKPRIVRPNEPRPHEDADVRNAPADFGDPESQRVLDAAADVLVEVLARQAARECFAEWFATQRDL